MTRLQRQAEKNLSQGLTRIRRWWSKKYNRPPTDPMFAGQTLAELNLEMLEDFLVERQRIIKLLDEGIRDLEERAELHDRLGEINELFGYEVDLGEDPLIDEWERDLESGRVPDLSKRTVG